MLSGNFGQFCHQQATMWDTGPTTDLKYPDRNLLPILKAKVDKQHCSKKVVPCIISLRTNSYNFSEWPSHNLDLNPIKYFWRNLKICICPHPWPWGLRRRMADNCQMIMRKYCLIKQKKTWDCNCASAKLNVWILMQCTYFSFLFLISLQSCDNTVFALSLWFMECRLMCEKKSFKAV